MLTYTVLARARLERSRPAAAAGLPLRNLSQGRRQAGIYVLYLLLYTITVYYYYLYYLNFLFETSLKADVKQTANSYHYIYYYMLLLCATTYAILKHALATKARGRQCLVANMVVHIVVHIVVIRAAGFAGAPRAPRLQVYDRPLASAAPAYVSIR
jgi:hypothetical protein